MVIKVSSVLLEKEARRKGDKGKGFCSSSPFLPFSLSPAVQIVMIVDRVYG
jgi:hypothetical protein